MKELCTLQKIVYVITNCSSKWRALSTTLLHFFYSIKKKVSKTYIYNLQFTSISRLVMSHNGWDPSNLCDSSLSLSLPFGGCLTFPLIRLWLLRCTWTTIIMHWCSKICDVGVAMEPYLWISHFTPPSRDASYYIELTPFFPFKSRQIDGPKIGWKQEEK